MEENGNKEIYQKGLFVFIILAVLTLGAHKGAEIIIKTEGDDADNALAALEELVLNNFGEG